MVDFAFLREKKNILLPIAGVLIFLLLLVGGRLFFEKLAEKQNIPNKNPDLVVDFLENLDSPKTGENAILPTPDKVSPLTGLKVAADIMLKPVAVMIENHPASRSQMRGLNEAGIVIEALTEGGITRFLVIFDSSERKKVGPVRSARKYFVEWAEEFGGAFVHAGGSEEALGMLEKSNLQNFDEDGDIVYRDFQYLKPHNLFVNLQAVRTEEPEWFLREGWFNFSNEIPSDAISAKQFSIDFSLPSYFVDYVYDSVNGNYKRLLGGEIHTANGDAIRPTNIVIQFTEYFPIDEEGRLELKTKGEDIAWYFSGGKMWQGVWKKIGGKTQFLDGLGNAVKLQPGQTFIEILDSHERVGIKDLMAN
ncbi:DUF3048 domain-containing protein [Candidatus Gracilibacteria bacterium]|nr:DUF3048 domain-containing protein [Candidatus Gracilibacteria bacterium]MCF7856432.1 DUF3048 domain-containing protein [Candidatus Gracilibacteria bacterium]MCF7896573.1 DUF3048 domain-containing protein [Candidatus Gracilibacteria bacterium]